MSKQYTLTFTVHLPDTATYDGPDLGEFVHKQQALMTRLCHFINSTLWDGGCAIKGQRVTIAKET